MSELTPMSYGRIVRPSIAHTIDKVNEVVDWINNSEIKSTKLVETGEGTEIQVGNATQLASLGMEGLAIQDGTPTPDNPVPIQVVRGRNLAQATEALPKTIMNAEFLTLNVPDWASVAGKTVTLSIDGTLNSSKQMYVYHYRTGGNLYITSASAGVKSITFTMPEVIGSDNALRIYVQPYDSTPTVIESVQLELGTTPSPYVPYGHVGLEVRDSSDELVSVTPIPLPSKGFAAALPDGTRDMLLIDSAGHCVIDSLTTSFVLTGAGIENINSNGNAYTSTILYENSNWGSGYCSICTTIQGPTGVRCKIGAANKRIYFQNAIPNLGANLAEVKAYFDANPVTVVCKGEPQTIDLGYIDLPTIPDNAKLRILATLEPGFNAGWFTEDALPMVVNALNARIESMGSSKQVGSLDSVRDHLEILDTPLEIGNELKPVEKQTEEQEEQEKPEEQEELEETEEK